MIKLERIKKEQTIKEEYIPRNSIKKCWSEEIVDKKEDYFVKPIPFSIRHLLLKKVDDMLYYQTYEGPNGEIYVYASPSTFPDIDETQRTNQTLFPGWNEIYKTPKETHIGYFIETDNETIEVTEKCFKNILD